MARTCCSIRCRRATLGTRAPPLSFACGHAAPAALAASVLWPERLRLLESPVQALAVWPYVLRNAVLDVPNQVDAIFSKAEKPKPAPLVPALLCEHLLSPRGFSTTHEFLNLICAFLILRRQLFGNSLFYS